MIKQMGEDYFYSCSDYEYLWDIEIPFPFLYVWSVFMELYNMSGEDGITWTSIADYEQVRDIKLRQIEIEYIIKISSWANKEISRLRDEE